MSPETDKDDNNGRATEEHSAPGALSCTNRISPWDFFFNIFLQLVSLAVYLATKGPSSQQWQHKLNLFSCLGLSQTDTAVDWAYQQPNWNVPTQICIYFMTISHKNNINSIAYRISAYLWLWRNILHIWGANLESLKESWNIHKKSEFNLIKTLNGGCYQCIRAGDEVCLLALDLRNGWEIPNNVQEIKINKIQKAEKGREGLPIKLKNSIKSSAIQFQGRFAEKVRRILFTEIVSVSQESSVIHLFLSFFSNSISVPVSLSFSWRANWLSQCLYFGPDLGRCGLSRWHWGFAYKLVTLVGHIKESTTCCLHSSSSSSSSGYPFTLSTRLFIWGFFRDLFPLKVLISFCLWYDPQPSLLSNRLINSECEL